MNFINPITPITTTFDRQSPDKSIIPPRVAAVMKNIEVLTDKIKIVFTEMASQSEGCFSCLRCDGPDEVQTQTSKKLQSYANLVEEALKRFAEADISIAKMGLSDSFEESPDGFIFALEAPYIKGQETDDGSHGVRTEVNTGEADLGPIEDGANKDDNVGVCPVKKQEQFKILAYVH